MDADGWWWGGDRSVMGWWWVGMDGDRSVMVAMAGAGLADGLGMGGNRLVMVP